MNTYRDGTEWRRGAQTDFKFLIIFGFAVFATNTAANCWFWQSIHPHREEYTHGYPVTWWLSLYAVPFATVLILGWFAAAARVFPLVILPIVAGLIAQGIGTAGFGLPGSGRAPVVPPGGSVAGSVAVGTVLWVLSAALGAGAYKVFRLMRSRPSVSN